MGEDVRVRDLGFTGIHFRYLTYLKIDSLSVVRQIEEVLVGDVMTVRIESVESSAPTTAVTLNVVRNVRITIVAHEHIVCKLHPRCLRMLDEIFHSSSLFCTFSVFVTTTTVEDKEDPF